MKHVALPVSPPPPHTSVASSLPYLPHLDGIRAAALLLVLAYHFRVPGAGGGYVGVDVFLVLSGYLMTRSIRGAQAAGTFHLLDWYASRFWRLYPAALATSATAVVAATALFPPDLAARAGASAAAAAGLVANVYFWRQEGYFDVASASKPLLHMWSLSLEEQFYALYPAVLVLLGRPWQWRAPTDAPRGNGAAAGVGDGAAPEGSRNGGGGNGGGGDAGAAGAAHRSHALTVAVVGVASTMSLGIAHLPALKPTVAGAVGASAAFFLLPSRVWEFGAGAAVALLLPAAGLPPGRFSDIAAVTGAVAVVGAAIVLRAGQYPVSAAVPAVVGAAAVIASPESVLARRGLSHPAARAVGRLSYAAYLVHWPAYVFGAYVANATRAAWLVHPVTMTAVTAAGAAAMHYGVEAPMRRVAKGDTRARRQRRVAMVAGAAATAALVGGCLATDGWADVKASGSGMTQEQGRSAMRAGCVDLPYGPGEKGKLSVGYSVGCIVSPGEVGVAAAIANNASLSRPPPVDAAVVGNSFTRALLGGLAAAAVPGQVLLVSYRGGCTFTTLHRFDRVARKQMAGCRSFVASQWALLRRLPVGTTVLVSNDWTTSRGLLHSAAAAAEIVAALRGMRLEPVVVGAPPAMAHPDKDYLFPCYNLERYILWPSWLRWRGRVWHDRGVSAASFCPRTYHPRPEALAAHNDLLAAAAAPRTAAVAPGYRYIDLMGPACERAPTAPPPPAPATSADLTCPAGTVNPVSGAYVLYYEPDGYHLTVYGSVAMAGPLQEVLANATRQPAAGG